MKTKPRSIAISSGKGGTGKTMLTANLGIALANHGKSVTILDGDLAMANLGIVMGMHKCPTSFLDVLSGNAKPKEALYENYGVKVMPTGFRFEDVHDTVSQIKRERVENVVSELLRDTDFLLIDAPAGIENSTILSIAAAREMIPVTNPNYSSLVDCSKTIRLANVLGSWTRGIVNNRVGKKTDISSSDIEKFMGSTLGSMPILAEVPEDDKVREAEREGIPVVVYEPECGASVVIDELAKIVAGESELPYKPYEEKEIEATTQQLIRALTGQSA